jgi:hypothetical protein
MIFHPSGLFEVRLKTLWFESHAEELGHVLESALFVCRTVSAIHIMNREQKPKSAFLQPSYGRGIGLGGQALGDPDRAGRNRLSVDFNETQPAGNIRMSHAFKIAEVRHINAVTQAGFEKDGPFRDLDLLLIHDDLDHETLKPRCSWQDVQ